MKPSPRTLASIAVFMLGAPSVALSLPHDDDPKILDRKPALKGSGFQRGLPVGALLPGGGRNPAHWNPSSLRPRQPTPMTSAASGPSIVLEAQLTLADLGGSSSGNDCWGYTSPSGREYAIAGASSNLVFVEITNPGAPVIVQQFSVIGSLWHDMKVHGTHCYAVSEAGDGIRVYDMSAIDSGTVTELSAVTGNGTDATHNVAINNASGFLYRTGGGDNGLRMYSLANLDQPVFVGDWNDKYVHDAQIVSYTSGPLAGRELAYCCAGLDGGFTNTGLTIVDVTNKANPIVLSEIGYADSFFSHQGWLSEDRQYFYLGDELDQLNGIDDTVTRVFDVSDPANPTFVSEFSNGVDAVSHNMYTKNGLLFQANYSSGLRIFDYASNPTNPQEVASFDTSPFSGISSNGLWSCYPYFDSGTVIGSDLEGGLFIWSTDLELGTEYCAGVVNSTGVASRIVASGSTQIAANNLRIEAVDLPPSSFGYFIAGPTQGLVMNPGGSQGNLCLAGTVGRFNASIANSGSAGTIALDVDNTAIPTPTGFISLSNGDTLNFQMWHRDSVAGQATSNFSSGYSVTFQ